jgi:hypothetical protein
MKAKLIILCGVIAFFGVCGVLFVHSSLYAADNPAASATVVTVKGEVVDLWCFISAGERGEGHKACAVTCAKAGNPIGLVDEKGIAYLLMGNNKMKPDRDSLIKEMANTVVVKGLVKEKGGLKAIYVESIESGK